ncbi:predicted protein [Sparassis crispa]|uniref:Serine protease n=1 Tax=Sparassis crispa TaxID=139825 RepID=A0A401H173_9APHY|nr:predicted protein [Sparassis crispa]GBE88164.1 predicted protein [Sparassis crispa]
MAQAYLLRKELRTVGNHPLKAVWEDNLALRIHSILESKGVKWTSTDVARIGFVGDLCGEDGLAVAKECKQLLVANEILDVEVEIRESVVTRYVGPTLRKRARSTPWAEGTGGFYVTGDDSKLYLVTARHVVFKPNRADNDTYERKFSSQPRVDVALFGTAAFNSYVKRIKRAIGEKAMILEFQERRVKEAVEGHDGMDADEAARVRANAEGLVKEAKEAIVAFKKLCDDATSASPLPSNLVKYTQDYALVEIDSSKIDAASFTRNAIDLGNQIGPAEFARLMFPNPENRHAFEYPTNGLFKVQGIISDEEMRRPTILDQNDDPCLIVMKRGNTTGLTVGRANDILSYVRNYFDDGDTQTSKEWAIFSYDDKSGPFSDEGDSGSGIIDCLGRLGGLLTGGDGVTEYSNVTYATPISFILDSLKANGYNVTVEATLSA